MSAKKKTNKSNKAKVKTESSTVEESTTLKPVDKQGLYKEGTTLNNIKIQEIKTRDDQKIFSFLKGMSEEVGFGTLNFSATIKGGKIVNIKQIEKITSFNINS